MNLKWFWFFWSMPSFLYQIGRHIGIHSYKCWMRVDEHIKFVQIDSFFDLDLIQNGFFIWKWGMVNKVTQMATKLDGFFTNNVDMKRCFLQPCCHHSNRLKWSSVKVAQRVQETLDKQGLQDPSFGDLESTPPERHPPQKNIMKLWNSCAKVRFWKKTTYFPCM